MKKILLIPFLFVCYLGMGQSSTPASIIGKPITIDKIIVAQHDFPKVMNWEDAKKECSRLGVGWRLPTKHELALLYKYRERIGNFFVIEDTIKFTRNLYYSSSEGGSHHGYINAWIQDFSNGEQFNGDKLYTYSIRAVKSF